MSEETKELEYLRKWKARAEQLLAAFQEKAMAEAAIKVCAQALIELDEESENDIAVYTYKAKIKREAHECRF